MPLTRFGACLLAEGLHDGNADLPAIAAGVLGRPLQRSCVGVVLLHSNRQQVGIELAPKAV